MSYLREEIHFENGRICNFYMRTLRKYNFLSGWPHVLLCTTVYVSMGQTQGYKFARTHVTGTQSPCWVFKMHWYDLEKTVYFIKPMSSLLIWTVHDRSGNYV